MPTTRTLSFVAIMLALASGSACSKQHESLPTTSGRTHTARSTPAPLTNAEVLQALIGANQSEVAEAQVVLQKSTNTDVREFATRMVADHTAGAREVQELANRRGIVAQPSRISRDVDDATRDELQELNRRSGNSLDRQYIGHEVAEHRELLDTIDREVLPATNDPEIQQVLRKTRSVVEAHLQHATVIEWQLPR